MDYKKLNDLLDEDSKAKFGFEKTSFYKDSEQFRDRIKDCFSSFDSHDNKFEDKYFNPLKELPEEYTLKRISEYNPSDDVSHPIKPILFSESELSLQHVHQGRVSNCYVLQCLLSIASRYPDKIRSAFPFPDLFEKGLIVIKLWDPEFKNWRLFFLDDKLPVKYENIFNIDWFGATPAGPKRNMFWCSFIEKCVARITSSYLRLSADSKKLSVSEVYSLVLGTYHFACYNELNHEKIGAYQVALMLDHFKAGSIISLSSSESKEHINRTTGSFSVTKASGLIDFHGYVLIDIRENVAHSGFNFVKCLNTWEKGGEWKGDWSDTSDLWRKYPKIRSELEFEKKEEGYFWIEKKDLPRAFCVIWIASFDPKFSGDKITVETERKTPYSEISKTEFNFRIFNDTHKFFKLIWVDYDGWEKFYGTNVPQCETIEQSSFLGHTWILKGDEKSCIFTLGKNEFKKNRALCNVSHLINDVEPMTIEKLNVNPENAFIKMAVANKILSALKTAQDPKKKPKNYKTIHISDDDFHFKLYNDTNLTYFLFWVDYDGKEVSYGSIKPYASKEQVSYHGHLWRLKNEKKLTEYNVFRIGPGNEVEVENETYNISQFVS